jgi:hypothetical protein
MSLFCSPAITIYLYCGAMKHNYSLGTERGC